jgi:hypothetical protein
MGLTAVWQSAECSGLAFFAVLACVLRRYVLAAAALYSGCCGAMFWLLRCYVLAVAVLCSGCCGAMFWRAFRRLPIRAFGLPPVHPLLWHTQGEQKPDLAFVVSHRNDGRLPTRAFRLPLAHPRLRHTRLANRTPDLALYCAIPKRSPPAKK